MKVGNELMPFTRVADVRDLKTNTFYMGKSESLLCFDLGKGVNEVMV